VSLAKIGEGERVRVSRVDGMMLYVEPVPAPDLAAHSGEILKGWPKS
jgi:hypothetical protein